MTTPEITITDQAVILTSPYHPALPSKAKALGGQFNGPDKSWRFDLRDEQRVRELAMEIYGTDGSAQGETVTVRVEVWSQSDEFWFAGRMIARRSGRDYDVRLGEGVIIVSGGFPRSGGSVKNPRLNEREGTVVEIRDLPRAAVESERGEYEIVEQTINHEALLAEREKLQARLAEIDALLDA